MDHELAGISPGSGRLSVAVRSGLRPAVMLAALLLITFSLAGIFAAPQADAAVVSVAQCNGQGPGPGGATTVMNCDITVVNTINGGVRSSVVTVSRVCALDPCTGSSSSSFSDVVTSVNQCNGSDIDAAHPINCNVRITNFISADTPGAQPITAATVNQCVGSGTIGCTPFPATTTDATVTQCNGSGTGGGGRVDCTVPASTISPAIPIRVNQCNGTGNPGGSIVTCSATIATTITAAAVTPTTAPPTTLAPTVVPTSAAVIPVTPAPSAVAPRVGAPGPTPPAVLATTPQVGVVPIGGVQAGGGSTAGLRHVGLLVLGGGLFAAAGFGAAVRRSLSHGS